MSEGSHVVAVLGRGLVDADERVITADDLGLTRGDGCFDSTLVRTDRAGNAAAVDLEGHLDRLERSARALDLDNPPRSAWRDLAACALDTWSTPGEAVLKLVLTRGREWRPAGPTAYVSVTHLRDLGTGEAGPPRTITAVTLTRGHPADAFREAPWLLGGVKTLSYVVNVAAQREARRRGADDVIFTTTDGYALDGPTSGLLVARDGVLLSTPPGDTGILESVTVEAIFEAARREGREARWALVPVEDLYRSDGLWLVSSGRGPVLVTELDGRPLRHDPGLAGDVAGYAGF
ncbi:aminodeoxychorismate lyase [Intrasporangium calvum]|uniref:Aminotransferase class IV n=1 Tax=Intrasporangium calvum (strain ATCC 23552 / DSM 43043 / JCM 3097 / NBRC 12989 / NCIMB 10167 / NRRL B-3866 / 7 KIP) TaxID=710696 RepID=E6SBZ6_INTC7|nr:aminodeoxychorismate lyase [Intrasporangium calvum]ADU49536.1 aminotransferase class IV [Intrasporangium calvum DSM 43043]AXG14458.1 aminodeoxychorismate lyase [Intrasporangium calvum]